jgi:hypothetical protein
MEPVVVAVDVDHALAALVGAIVAWRNAQTADAGKQVEWGRVLVSWSRGYVAQYDRHAWCG